MLDRRVKELSGGVERTHMFHSERVLTCVSEASKDKDAPQRLAGEGQPPDLDRDTARVQDGFADKP